MPLLFAGTNVCNRCGLTGDECACPPPLDASVRTIVVNKHRYAGADAVSIMRPSEFGNPFPAGKTRTREEAIAQFKDYFLARVRDDRQFRDLVLTLRGKILGCCCHPKACHGDVIASWLDGPDSPR